MWEYKREHTNYGSYTPEQFMKLLNSYGREGWELVHYQEQESTSNQYIFKVVMKRRKGEHVTDDKN